MKRPSKSCALDPIPTWLLKSHIDAIAPAITTIINKSITSATVPDCLKEALVTPLLKKASLNKELFKNYRPVSNLSFVSKVLEKHVDKHLSDFAEMNNLTETFQSAYSPFHSTETALLRVQSDLLMSVDTTGAAVLVLLDLSAAFDTIDHNILLDRLNVTFGIKDRALDWIRSYLTDRCQRVTIQDHKSTPQYLLYGVPQGSVWGPKAFTKYSIEIGNIAKKHGLLYHCYADDTQLYAAFHPRDEEDISTTQARIQACVKEISAWMTSNYLQLNEEKTEVLIIHRQPESPITETLVGEKIIVPQGSVKNLGVIMDSSLMFEEHIKNVCRTAFMEIRNIGRIRKFLDEKSTASLVHAFVISKIDYCNSLLHGLPQRQLDKLQRVMNTAARVISRTRKYEHITPVLFKLHWLPVPERIIFKILLLTFKALHGMAPVYLTELLTSYEPQRTLRSTHQNLLLVPRTKLKYYGDRSFSKCAPVLWNNLPLELRQATELTQFKSKLKTHLFKAAYNC
jgi:hypothetical protein